MGGVVSTLSDPAFFIDLREQRTLALGDLGELLGSIELIERDEPLHIGEPAASQRFNARRHVASETRWTSPSLGGGSAWNTSAAAPASADGLSSRTYTPSIETRCRCGCLVRDSFNGPTSRTIPSNNLESDHLCVIENDYQFRLIDSPAYATSVPRCPPAVCSHSL